MSSFETFSWPKKSLSWSKMNQSRSLFSFSFWSGRKSKSKSRLRNFFRFWTCEEEKRIFYSCKSSKFQSCFEQVWLLFSFLGIDFFLKRFKVFHCDALWHNLGVNFMWQTSAYVSSQLERKHTLRLKKCRKVSLKFREIPPGRIFRWTFVS